MTIQHGKRPAAFIDRDGTLIEEVNFLSKVSDLELFPYTADAIRMLKDAGFWVIVVTNQSGIGREIYTEADMHAIHDAMQEQLDGAIDAFFFCPHLPDAGCRCRKPNLGMVEDAQDAFDIDMEHSWMIGDKRIDVETGKNAGIRSALVLTGYGSTHRDELSEQPDIIAENLLDAIERIVTVRQAADAR